MSINNYNSDLYAERPRLMETSAVHQPVLIMLDTSTSMLKLAENGLSKADIVKQCVRKLKDIGLYESEKAAIDICIMAFDDDVRTLVDWIPLSEFDGEIDFDCDGCTALSDAIIEGIEATRTIRAEYDSSGINARRAQFFLWTDGASTQDMAPAVKRSEEYLCREFPSCKLNVILVPPAVDPREIMQLGKKVAIFSVEDCANGIPDSFQFLQDSIVEWSQSAPGQDVIVKTNGMRFIDGYGGVQKNSDGGAVVTDSDIDKLWSK